MSRADWVLLTLYFAGKKGLTPAQLQKSLFLFQKAFPRLKKVDYSFKPYNYGPFDVSVYKDAEAEMEDGFTTIRYRNGQSWGNYHLTSAGAKKIKKYIEKDNDTQKYLCDLVQWAQSISFQELVGSIYKKYPEYKVNSIFKGA